MSDRPTASTITDSEVEQLLGEREYLAELGAEWTGRSVAEVLEEARRGTSAILDGREPDRPVTRIQPFRHRPADAEERMSHALSAVRQALEALPAQCRYHGDNLAPDRLGQRYGRDSCCDTGRPARLRQLALQQLDATS